MKKIRSKINNKIKEFKKEVRYVTIHSVYYSFVLLLIVVVSFIILFVFARKSVYIYKELDKIESDINIGEIKQVNIKDFLKKVEQVRKKDSVQ